LKVLAAEKGTTMTLLVEKALEDLLTKINEFQQEEPTTR